MEMKLTFILSVNWTADTDKIVLVLAPYSLKAMDNERCSGIPKSQVWNPLWRILVFLCGLFCGLLRAYVQQHLISSLDDAVLHCDVLWLCLVLLFSFDLCILSHNPYKKPHKYLKLLVASVCPCSCTVHSLTCCCFSSLLVCCTCAKYWRAYLWLLGRMANWLFSIVHLADEG